MTNTTRDRIHATLLGGAIGDALGNPIEFLGTIDAIRDAYGPDGITDLDTPEVTDDTQMTLFTVEGMLRADEIDGEIIPSMRAAYMRWLDTQGHPVIPEPTHSYQTGWLRREQWLYARRAPGATCISGLSRGDWQEIYDGFTFGELTVGEFGPINTHGKGCGTVMRSAPFGLTAKWDPFEAAAQCSYLTHGHPTAALSSGAFALIINRIINGASLWDACTAALARVAMYPNHRETVTALHGAMHLSEFPADYRTVEEQGGAWIAEEALAIGVYCALTEPDPRKALLLAVNHGGDSDSTGAITGSILGAMHGTAALPADWAARVEGTGVIARLATDLAAL